MKNRIFKVTPRTILAILMLVLLQFPSCVRLTKNQTQESVTKPTTNVRTADSSYLSFEEKWGIKIVGIKLTAAGHMLDFRYKVLDSEKASLFLKRQVEPYLVDQETGAKLSIPRTRLGPMRQTSVKPEENRDYFMLFGNPTGLIKPGSKVTLVIGDLKIEDLVVE